MISMSPRELILMPLYLIVVTCPLYAGKHCLSSLVCRLLGKRALWNVAGLDGGISMSKKKPLKHPLEPGMFPGPRESSALVFSHISRVCICILGNQSEPSDTTAEGDTKDQ